MYVCTIGRRPYSTLINYNNIRKTNGYHYTIIRSTKRFDTYGGNPPENVVPSM